MEMNVDRVKSGKTNKERKRIKNGKENGYANGNGIKNPYDMVFDKHNTKTIVFNNNHINNKEQQYSHCSTDISTQTLLSYLNEAYDKVEGVIHYLSHNEKIEAFIQLIQNPSYSQSSQLGGLIAIYLLTSRLLAEEHSSQNIQTLLSSICNLCLYILTNFKNYSELFLICSIDILTLINDTDLLIPNINLISLFLTDNNYPSLQSSAFTCLFHLGHPGLAALIEICKTYPRYQQLILPKLINTPHIQHIIIVRSLLNELFTKDSKRIHHALYALNRLYWIVSGEDNVEFAICEMFNDARVDKMLIASTLRTSGELGEKMILGLAKTHSDFSVRSAICKVMGYEIGEPKYLKIVIDFDRSGYIKGKGSCVPYRYHGKECAVCSEGFNEEGFYDEERKCEWDGSYLEVYSEEVLAALNRMIQLDYKHINAFIDYDKTTYKSIFSYDNLQFQNASHLHPLNLHIIELTSPSLQLSQTSTSTQSTQITPIINVLCQCLKDKQSSVRNAAIRSLHKIGYPSAQSALPYLLSLLPKETDPNIISSILSALSVLQFPESQLQHLYSIINHYLLHPTPHVQLTTLSLIPLTKPSCPPPILDLLRQRLLSQEVNKLSYVKALLHAGNPGENILISLFDKNDFKLQANIAQGFAFADPFSSNIDFIIETLLKHQDSNSALVRKNVLLTLSTLSKFENISTILCNKNVLDIYYKKLSDFDEQIGCICMGCLVGSGAKGELLMIQGVLNDKNWKTRMFCVRGLVRLGVHNFNTLVIVLMKEKNQEVRREVEKGMLKGWDVGEVVNYWKGSGRGEGVIINVSEVLKVGMISGEMKKYLNIIKEALQAKK